MANTKRRIAGIAAAVIALAASPAHASTAGPYSFKNLRSAVCLDANWTSVYNNTCDGNPYQRFWVTKYASGLVSLKSVGTKRCLDGNSAGDLYVSACNGSDFQAFSEISRSVNGTTSWRYQHKKSGRCLGLYFDAVKLAPCDNLYVWWRQLK